MCVVSSGREAVIIMLSLCGLCNCIYQALPNHRNANLLKPTLTQVLITFRKRQRLLHSVWNVVCVSAAIGVVERVLANLILRPSNAHALTETWK